MEVDIDLLVGNAVVLPVGSYVQHPWLEVHNKQVAGQQLFQGNPKQSHIIFTNSFPGSNQV